MIETDFVNCYLSANEVLIETKIPSVEAEVNSDYIIDGMPYPQIFSKQKKFAKLEQESSGIKNKILLQQSTYSQYQGPNNYFVLFPRH